MACNSEMPGCRVNGADMRRIKRPSSKTTLMSLVAASPDSVVDSTVPFELRDEKLISSSLICPFVYTHHIAGKMAQITVY